MKRLGKISLWIAAINFIITGLAHLKVHYADMVTPQLEETLTFNIDAMGITSDVYGLWQGTSFMMGICFIVIGLLNINSLFQLKQGVQPSVMQFVSMIFLMIAVTYSGYNFFSAMQIYGGYFGITILTLGLIASLRTKTS